MSTVTTTTTTATKKINEQNIYRVERYFMVDGWSNIVTSQSASQQHVRQQMRWENQHGAKASNKTALVWVNVHWTYGRGKQWMPLCLWCVYVCGGGGPCLSVCVCMCMSDHKKMKARTIYIFPLLLLLFLIQANTFNGFVIACLAGLMSKHLCANA